MGLGKTLSSLSLICHSLDHMDGDPSLGKDLPRATLIVTPKSSEISSIPCQLAKYTNYLQRFTGGRIKSKREHLHTPTVGCFSKRY